MQRNATTIYEYLAGMPPDRRKAIEAVRAVILANLPDGYVEAFNWGMISYEAPLEMSGKTYNGKPLMYAALANQKNHMGVYLCGLHCIPGGSKKLAASFRASGRKLDMGQACVRFRTIDDLDLDAVAESIAAVPPEKLIAASNEAHRKR